MNIKLSTEKLNEILASFYEMNGMRIVIFDSECHEIFAYPKENCRFCQEVKNNTVLREYCHISDSIACAKSLDSDDIYIYKCHAGLIEAVMPLIYEKQIVGYIMFGQITDKKDKAELSELVTEINEKYGLKCEASGIKYRSKKQIAAAAKILEICTEYIILKGMIALENNKIIAEVKSYIKNNLSEDLRVDEICRQCNIGRTKLYRMFRKECGIGISQYITEKRLNNARKLLKSTELTITEISAQCGFCDYNYFSRVYKKRFGISPKSEQKNKF